MLKLDRTGTLHTTEELRVKRGPNLPGKVAKAWSIEPCSIMLSPISRAPVAVRLQISLEVLSYIIQLRLRPRPGFPQTGDAFLVGTGGKTTR